MGSEWERTEPVAARLHRNEALVLQRNDGTLLVADRVATKASGSEESGRIDRNWSQSLLLS